MDQCGITAQTGTLFPASLRTSRKAMGKTLRNAPGMARKATAAAAILLMALLLPAGARGELLSDADRAYLHTLQEQGGATLCVDPDWIPFEHVDAQGSYTGIGADLLGLVSERAGIPFTLVPTRDWDESIRFSKEGRCRILGFLNSTPAREEWLVFTDPLFTDPNVIITREEHPYIVDPGHLSGESIVFPKGTGMEERVRVSYPDLRILNTETEAQAIAMVSGRGADMTIRSLIVAAYTIRKEGLFNLKIGGQLPEEFSNRLRIGVRREDAQLRDILNKAIATITPQERGQIVNRHVVINVQTVVDYMPVLRIAAAVLVLAGIGFLWNYRLSKLNAELKRISRTDALTGLPNRLMLTSRLHEEMERAARYQRPFSIILLDVDSFKAVNDDLGHLTGDRVLVAMGDIARHTLRGTDMAGRWGGEEFLVLCPESGEDEARQVAERIRLAVEQSTFASNRPETISAGVTALRPGDTADALLQRADTALYAAKNSGKNRVCVAAHTP